MAIRFDRFTEKAQEAILHAQELVRSGGHPQMESLHLLLALVEQQDGVVPRVLERLGTNVLALRGRLRAELDRWPRQRGAVAAEGWHASAARTAGRPGRRRRTAGRSR